MQSTSSDWRGVHCPHGETATWLLLTLRHLQKELINGLSEAVFPLMEIFFHTFFFFQGRLWYMKMIRLQFPFAADFDCFFQTVGVQVTLLHTFNLTEILEYVLHPALKGRQSGQCEWVCLSVSKIFHQQLDFNKALRNVLLDIHLQPINSGSQSNSRCHRQLISLGKHKTAVTQSSLQILSYVFGRVAADSGLQQILLSLT